jgi:hypothetical protein
VCALEEFLGVALVGVHSARTGPVVVDSLRGHSGCTWTDWACIQSCYFGGQEAVVVYRVAGDLSWS